MDYRYGSHTIYNIEYQVLQGDIGQRVRDLVRQTCEAHELQPTIHRVFRPQ